MEQYKNHSKLLQYDNGIKVVCFEKFLEIPWLTHGFSTKCGGYSLGSYATLNLRYGTGDDENAVTNNLYKFCNTLKIDYAMLTSAHQTHTTNILYADYSMAGNGYGVRNKYEDIDGLITDKEKMVLTVYCADCVPLYVVDTKHRAIGVAHAGWKGTLNHMPAKLLNAMKAKFHTKPSDCIVGIGPCICEKCYEVGDEVSDLFLKEFSQKNIVTYHEDTKKHHISLKNANVASFIMAGVSMDNICVSQYCTMCEEDLFYSHRRTGRARGQQIGILSLK